MAQGFFDFLRKTLGWLSSGEVTPPLRRFFGRLHADNLSPQLGSLRANNVLPFAGSMQAGNLTNASGSLGSATMASHNDFECSRGEAFAADLDDVDGVDRSAQTLIYRLRVGSFAGDVILTKTVGSGLSFPSGGPGGAGTRLRVTLSSTNTNLTPGTYYHTVTREDVGYEAVLEEGKQKILPPKVGV